MLILIFGGIPWQVYFQRVLSARSEKSAMYLSYVAALGCLLSGIPPAIIGMIGKATGKFILIRKCEVQAYSTLISKFSLRKNKYFIILLQT